MVGTHKLSKCPRVGTKNEGKCPAPGSSPSNSFFINQWIKCSTVQYVNAVVRLLGQQYVLVAFDYIYLFLALNISSKWRNIPNWENIPLKTSTSYSSPWRTIHCFTNASSFPLNSSMALLKNTFVKYPGDAPGYINAQPPGRDKIANVLPPGLTVWANAPRLPGGGGGWALLELTDA